MPATRLYGPTGAPGPNPAAINTPLNAVSPASLPATLLAPTQTSEQIVQDPSVTSAANPIALVAKIAAGSLLEQRQFSLSCTGVITTGGTTNVTAKIYSGSSTTPGSNTLLGSSGAVAQNSASCNFTLQCPILQYDSVSGKLTGTVKFLINNTLVAEVAISNVVTGINDANNPVAVFCVSFTFSAAFAANKVVVAELGIYRD